MARVRWSNAMLGKHNAFNIKDNQTMSPVNIGPTLGQRSIFQQTFIQNQSGRHTLVQCWPNVMHPIQLGHVKTSRWCTLAQRWVYVVF